MGRPKTETIKFLSQDEAGRLFHELSDHKRNNAIFLVAYRHGLRASEVALLRTSDLDFKNPAGKAALPCPQTQHCDPSARRRLRSALRPRLAWPQQHSKYRRLHVPDFAES